MTRPDGARPDHDPTARGLRSRRVVALASTLASLAVLAVGYLVPLRWVDELPDPVATHWGTDGPDGFTSLDGIGLLAPTLVMAALVVLLGVLIAVLGTAAFARRVLAGTSVGLAALVATLQIVSLGTQRGLADARDATDAGIGVSLLVALLVGATVGLALPRDRPLPATAPVDPDAPRASLDPHERAAWVARTRGGPGLAIGALAIAGTAVVAVVLETWWLLLLPVLLGLLLAAMLEFVVRVDERGLQVCSALGVPRTLVPADEVERAGVVAVDPVRDFGGWGWRVGRGGRVGVVVRKGPGLLVERTGGRSFVVTVDDPDEGAALLNALADRARR
ncbi:hypothetical protein CLV28_0025 [Sediminihabitans luteus]|uniref:DUF1648 domain-containing protein n=1 Tax=Sediminihabitans luteus TaxID=1138585 RepID=A0A2M9CY13_9CELL|nr:DUF1648 domain-containing protein [Sediminihabitans luteus]PJJ76821.1 hypothetical protein CLV28_0025 [Sediminihabitans luteus]GIJ00300.1 hypothetical protein Slu03_26770 [Sediminihabitans luteus]